MVEGFTIKACLECGGPEIFSKVRPLAKCVRCGVRRDLPMIRPVPRRWRCERCRTLFRAVLGVKYCGKCRDGDGARERRQRRRRKGQKMPKNIERIQGK
jgi:hypothetical protein